MQYYPNPYMLEEGLEILIPVLFSAVPSSLFAIVTYVLTSLALYTLASRRGIGSAWLSWVPVLNVWIVGSLSDQYRYVVKGQYKSKRKALILLNLIKVIILIIAVAALIFMAVDMISGFVYGAPQDNLASLAMAAVLGLSGLALPLAGLAIAVAIIRYMALFDIYRSMDPDNSILFLVLSILFRVTEPFFLFFNRQKDLGMPPRKQEPQWIPPEETWQPPENKDYL